MVLRYHYSHPTTPAGAGFDTVIADAVQIDPGHRFTAAAALGDAAIVGVTVDDPAAAYDFAGLNRWYLVEDACPSDDHYAWNGYIGVQRIDRGDGAITMYPIDAGRRWDLELSELNAILSFRIITGSDGNRPAETVGDRLAWLLGSDYLATVHDAGLVVYPATDLDKNDYRGQDAKNVLSDLAVQTGFLFFAYYDQPSGHVSLFFDDPNSDAYASSARISNIGADVDGTTTFAAEPTAVLARDPSRVAAGVYLPYSGGSVYRTNLSTSYAFGFRDQAAPTANVKTEAKATALADRFLADNAEQDERITCRVQLPAAHLNDIKHGQRMRVRFQHFPGYETWRWCRVVRKTFAPPANRAQSLYDVDLELSPQTGPCSDTEGAGPDALGGTITDTAMSTTVPAFPIAPTTPQGYVYHPAGSPAVPVTTFLHDAEPSGFNPSSFAGTPNNGSTWGLSPTVNIDHDRTTARWAWDLGESPPPICSVVISTFGSIPNPAPVFDGHPFGYTDDVSQWSTHKLSVQASDDGTTWHEVVSAADVFANVLPQSFSSWSQSFIKPTEARHRYWALLFDVQLGGGGFAGFHYMGGITLVNVSLYEVAP